MTLTVNLPQATIAKLHAQAAASGKDVDTIVREAVEVKLAISGPSFREILAPVHEEFEKSGMTDEELDALAAQAVREAREARSASHKQR